MVPFGPRRLHSPAPACHTPGAIARPPVLGQHAELVRMVADSKLFRQITRSTSRRRGRRRALAEASNALVTAIPVAVLRAVVADSASIGSAGVLAAAGLSGAVAGPAGAVEDGEGVRVDAHLRHGRGLRGVHALLAQVKVAPLRALVARGAGGLGGARLAAALVRVPVAGPPVSGDRPHRVCVQRDLHFTFTAHL